MTIRSGSSRLWFSALLLAIGGCVTAPTVDVSKLGAPKSVAIVDIPDVKPLALIGIIVPHAGGPNQFHFSERSDEFFVVEGAARSAVPMYSTGQTGLVPALIEYNAADTQQKAGAFGAEIVKVYPGFDLRADFMKALRGGLEARGVTVSVLADGRTSAPRLRWPAADAQGKYPSGSLDGTPPVDADIVLQVCPIAMYNSPGPLNYYNLRVSVGVAIYDGRTRQFLGRQALRFIPVPDSRSYARYDSLVADLKQAAPLMRDGLVSLAPQIADLATGRQVKQ